VIRDFLNIVGRRHSGLNVMLYPASVQGESAPVELEDALARLNASGLVDVIVIARGGGSLEDLAAFNSERVARAIAGSTLPVVSAIGHETDFTIADFVADLRAPTPSAAAELITEAQHKVAERVADQTLRLERAARFRVLQARQQVDSLHAERAEWRISSLLQRLQQRLDDSVVSLERSMRERLRADRRATDEFAELVMRHDPRRLLGETRERLASTSTRLDRSMERLVRELSAHIHATEARLHALSPLEVLDRGYALVHDANGVLIRSIAQLGPDEVIRTRVRDGSFSSRIQGLDSDKPRRAGKK
jgi:exodeoxyribonuclease VII large subunit